MSSVTPLEIAGIVARQFGVSPKALATRRMGRNTVWPLPLLARAVAVRLIRAHTEAPTGRIAALFELSRQNAAARFADAERRLRAEESSDPTVADRIAACEVDIDALHEERVDARDRALSRRQERESVHG